jgi:hypothetical protein
MRLLASVQKVWSPHGKNCGVILKQRLRSPPRRKRPLPHGKGSELSPSNLIAVRRIPVWHRFSCASRPGEVQCLFPFLLPCRLRGITENLLVSLARKLALNSRGMFSEPATHLLVGPCPFNRVGVPMVVFRPRSRNMRLEFLLTLPGRTLQVIVLERMNQDLCLV